MSSKADTIEFTKMHGIGNDYVYIDCVQSGWPEDIPSLAREMSDRHTGVGGDGIILIGAPTTEGSDLTMRIINADGSEAMMCGNGVRCVGKYAWDHGLSRRNPMRVDTLSGTKILTLDINPVTSLVSSVTVDMGRPAPAAVTGSQIEAIGGTVKLDTAHDGTLEAVPVSMGNPHAVIFLSSPDDVHFELTGPELERHPLWPDRANIEMAVVRSRGDIDMRVWERGSGETMACGTGACATAVAAIALGLTDRRVTVHLRGGDLEIEWSGSPDSPVMMTGGATEVFKGSYLRRDK